MKRTFEMDGDRWTATVDRRAAHPGMQAVVFHCISDSQRPYRVVEIPAQAAGDEAEPEFTERELRDLFGNTHTMDYSYDESAEPRAHGYGARHL